MTSTPTEKHTDLDRLMLSKEARWRCEALPRECLAFLPENELGHRIVVIQRGLAGFKQSRYDHAGLSEGTARLIVADVNRHLCVSPAQREAMLAGCRHGWEAPIVDAGLYSDVDVADALALLPTTGRPH